MNTPAQMPQDVLRRENGAARPSDAPPSNVSKLQGILDGGLNPTLASNRGEGGT